MATNSEKVEVKTVSIRITFLMLLLFVRDEEKFVPPSRVLFLSLGNGMRHSNAGPSDTAMLVVSSFLYSPTARIYIPFVEDL